LVVSDVEERCFFAADQLILVSINIIPARRRQKNLYGFFRDDVFDLGTVGGRGLGSTDAAPLRHRIHLSPPRKIALLGCFGF
jgi:hypothetical protein